LLLASSGALGCSTGVALEPAKSANETAPGTAYTIQDEVTVQANGESWSGDSELKDFVTPVYLAIVNSGEEPVRIRYSNIRLVADNGDRFAALPPFDVHGTVRKKVDRLVPRFGYRGATLAPYLGNVYEDVEVEPPPAYMDYEYYDYLYDHWRAKIPLPTKYMQEVALPEARLQPQGEISGYDYFERVPASNERVRLEVDLIDANTSDTLGTASIPFVVDD
jgi:hypothetical protein